MADRDNTFAGSVKDDVTPLSINAQTGTAYTAALDDAKVGALLTLSNASAITFTLPQDSDVAFAIGSIVDFMQLGAGQVTVAAGSGATLRKASATAKMIAQYAVAKARKVSANTWVIYPSGDFAAS